MCCSCIKHCAQTQPANAIKVTDSHSTVYAAVVTLSTMWDANAGLGVPNLCYRCRQRRRRVCCTQPHSGARQLRWQLGGHHDRPEGPAVHLHGCPRPHSRQKPLTTPGTHTPRLFTNMHMLCVCCCASLLQNQSGDESAAQIDVRSIIIVSDNAVLNIRALICERRCVQQHHHLWVAHLQATSGNTDDVVEAQLLEMIRNGSHPLDAYGISTDIPKVSIVLAKVLQSCQLQLGSYRTINPNK